MLGCAACGEPFTEAEMVTEANAFIAENAKNTDERWRGDYHLAPRTGWMNDPNGFVYFKGKYHVFYQYHPYAPVNGVMYWGHAVSEDLVKWEHLGAAIAPDQTYDADGCWSGSAIERNGRLYLIYTGHTDRNGVRVQTQNVAYSDDGIVFKKYERNPVIGKDLLPEGTSIADFRDPYVWEREGAYYLLVGTMETGAAKVLLYRSDDLLHWEFVNTFLRRTHAGFCWECPALTHTNGTDLLLLSPVDYPHAQYAFWNYNSAVYATGTVNYGSGTYTGSAFSEIDYGLDFYAPQAIRRGDATVMAAWMNMWGRSYMPALQGHGWSGSLALPRVLTVKEGKLYQKPVPAIAEYYGETVSIADSLSGEKTYAGVSGRCVRIKVRADLSAANAFSVSLFVGDGCRTVLTYDRKSGTVTLDRTQSGYAVSADPRELSQGKRRVAPYSLRDGVLEMEIFLDKSSIEVFFGEGELAMTSLSYNPVTADGVRFSCNGTARIEIEKNEIVVE